jgi:hypothetical protein
MKEPRRQLQPPEKSGDYYLQTALIGSVFSPKILPTGDDMRSSTILVFALILTLGIGGCAPAPATATAIPPTDTPQPPPTTTPTPAPDFGPWNLVRQIKYSDPDSSINYGGFLDASFGVLVGASGLIEHSGDGGKGWNISKNESWCLFGLDIVDENVAWTCGNAGHVRLTTDRGKTWTVVSNYGPGEPNHCRYLSFLDEKTGWAATPAMLGATSDGATTWTDVILPIGIGKITAISLRTPADGYVLDDQGLLHATADGGTTWTSLTVDLPREAPLPIDYAPLATMRFWDADHGRIVIMKNGFWTGDTSDGGATWIWKLMPDLKGFKNSYLTHDGQLLTAVDVSKREIVVLRYNGS